MLFWINTQQWHVCPQRYEYTKTKNHVTGLKSVYFAPDHKDILPVIIMVQFAEDDKENESLENQQVRCATCSSERPVQFASDLSKVQPLSEVGLIFKLENILTGCFGDCSMNTAVIWNNDIFDGTGKGNRPRSGKMDLVDLKLVVVILAGKTTTTTKLMHKVQSFKVSCFFVYLGFFYYFF